MPSAGESHFLHTFFWRLQKKYGVGRDATRRSLPLPVARDLRKIINKGACSGRQPGDFLYWSKESHQRKDRFGAALGICACRLAVILPLLVGEFIAPLRSRATKGALFIGGPRVNFSWR
jgi:hypothetical protein